MQLSELNAHRHTAATRFGEISYLDIGAGPTALFVHGVATNAYLWRHVMDALSGQRRCIAIDLPLHGQSPVTAEQDLWPISDYLFSIPHKRLLTSGIVRNLNRMDARLMAAGKVGAV